MINLKLQRYLGDGVYAGFDGYQYWIYADRDGQRHSIALEPGTFTALFGWVGDVRRLIAAHGKDAMKREQL